MAKHLNLSLGVTADTSQAKAQLQDLQKQLNNLTKSTAKSSTQGGLTKEINDAITATAKLKTMLEASTNVNTGNLDLSKFSQQLKSSGMDLKAYANHLTQLGPAGEQAFMSLAKSVVSAEVPLKRSNALISETWTTLKNTARWQFSSSMLHGFIGSIQAAHGYAQDLNESLNNIRIVTGQNIDQMTKFAQEANKAARALSTTTTDYTNASLIYYQQGLDDSQVKERTDITVKMANAAGVSADVVSDQLTAIWNNFADGSKSLEYYADAITALGAKTASSTDEIAGGLEKFAAVADTIGLSYEYATSALATITAETRQSEDVVGTALKTIFSRIQGLNLGETLDDGTTLNKYSDALLRVGINIKDSNGELKTMDSILNEMGSKWENINKDQQIALAQTVAGVRQYNQLVALMDNWDVMQDNLAIVADSTGTLNEQAEIYAESWEASSDRVRAAAEKIYADLMNEEFFISFNNIFEKVLVGIGGLVDGLNGLPGVLSMVGTVATTVFGKQMEASVNSAVHNLRVFTGVAESQTDVLRKQMIEAINEFNSGLEPNSAGAFEGQVLTQQINRTMDLKEATAHLTEEQVKFRQELINIEAQYGDVAVAAKKAMEDALQSQSEVAKSHVLKVSERAARGDAVDAGGYAQNIQESMAQYERAKTELFGIVDSAEQAHVAIKKIHDGLQPNARGTTIIKAIETDIGNSIKAFPQLHAAIEKYRGVINNSTSDDKAKSAALRELKSALEQASKETYDAEKASQSAAAAIRAENDILGLTVKEWLDLVHAKEQVVQKTKEAEQAEHNYEERIKATNDAIDRAGAKLGDYGKAVVGAAQGISSILMAWNSMKGAIDALNNEDMSFGEKFVAVLTSMSMAIPSLAFGLQALKKAREEWITTEKLGLGVHLASIAGMKAEELGITSLEQATVRLVVQRKVEQMQNKSGIAGHIASGLAKIFETSATWGLIASIAVLAAGVLAAIAVVWLIVKAFEAWKASTPEAQLKALEERANASAEAFNKVSEAVEGVKSKLEELQTTYDTIDSLTRGTAEWYENIAKVNNEVSELLKLYPELNEHIVNDGGVLKLQDSGFEYIENLENNRLLAANNIKTNDQMAVNQQKIDNAFEDSSFYGYTTSSQELWDMVNKLYQDDRVGDNLFTREMAEEITNSIWGTREQHAAQYTEGHEQYGYDDWESQVETVQYLLEDNKDLIKQIDELNTVNTQLQDAQFTGRLASLGSTRTIEEGYELLGEEGFDGAVANSRKKVEETFGDWNDHYNYDSHSGTTDDEWAMIEDFMKLKGDEAKYVAQRNGKMVLEIDGEEFEYSKDEVYDALAELYSGPEIEARMTEALQETLSTSLGGVDLSQASLEDLNILDNFQRQIADSLQGTNMADQADAVFKGIMDAYGANEEGIQAFKLDTEFIDTTGPEFQEKIKALADSRITVEEFTQALREMNAEGKLDSMTEFFQQAAEGMGLSEEDAASMQAYAKHLLEVSDDSDILADSLKEDADSAADLAIEITRMNKGIETLGENFENWNDILKNSDKTSMEYAEAIIGMKSALADVLDVEEDLISSDFVTEHLEEIEKAAQGDAEAIDSLRASMDEEIVTNITLGQTDEFINKVNELDAELKANIPDNIEVGAILQDEAFLAAANNLVQQAGMTADEANAYFAGIGYEPVYSTTDIENANSMQTPNASTTMSIDHIGWSDVPVDLPDWFPGDHTITLPEITYSAKPSIKDPSEAPANMRLTSFSGDGTPPQIKGLRKKASGSMNNYSSTNSGGTSNSSGNKGSKKKPVKKDNSQYKKSSKEAERYHEVKNELEAIEHELEMISKEKDRAFGQDKIDAINKETKALEKQRKAQEKYHNEIRDNLKKDQQALAKYGATFDGDPDNPNITNYDEMVKAQVDAYNAAYNAYIQEQNDAVDAYNNSNRDEKAGEVYDDAKEKADERWKAAQDAYKEFQEEISQYEDTVDLFDESEETLKDIENQLYDLELEKIEYKLQIKLDIADDELEYLEYLLSKTEDDAFKAAEAIANLEEQVGVSMEKIEAYKSSLNEIFEKHGLGEQAVQDLLSGKLTEEELKKLNLTEKEIEMIREAKNGLLEENQTLMELQKTMREKVTEAFEAFVEEIDKGIAKMEHLAKITDGYKNIIDLVGRKTLGIGKDLMKTLNNTAIQNSMNTLAANQRKLEALSKSRADMEAKRQEAEKQGLTDTANYWAEQIELVDEKIREAQESSMDMIGDTLEKINEEFERAVNDAIASFEAAMSGTFGNLDALQDAYDRQSEIDERYIDDYTQIYELTKLTRNINNSIDDTQNIKGKQELKKLLNEINDIQAKGIQMSEYDLKYLQGKYDLKLAEIALEEAQNAKSQVRMVQDNEGNWGYMYTADQDKIDEAQQNYEDKLHALSQMTDEYLDETEAKILATQQEFAEAVAALKDQEWEDQAAFQQALDELTAYYQGKLAYLMGEEEKAINNNKDLMDDYTKTYGEDVAAQIQSNTDFVTSFDQTKLSYVTGIGDMQTYLQTFTAASNALLNEMGAAYSTWAIQIDTALGLIGSSVDTFAGDVSEAMGEISRESDQAKQDVDDAAEQMELDFKLVLDAAQNFETQYQTIVKGIIDQNELLVKSFNNALDAWSEFEDEDSGNSGGSGSSGGGDNGGNSGGGSSGGGGGAGSGNGSPDVGDVVTYTGGLYYGDSYGGGQTGQRGPGKQVKITQVKTDGRPYPIHVVSSDSAYGWLTASQLSGFDTGGYTGDWAGYAGKLALLHKKELILNEEDTSNFLSALGIVRDISQMIDLNAHAASYGLGLMSSIGVRDSAQTIEQQVTIHAEFPNANNHSEIEEAFNNLINTATQYANRKK